jgi:HK97 family phage major capsid protein
MYDLDGELSDGDMHFANRTLTPHKAGVCIPIPYSLILQARPEIDAIVQDDMVKALDEIRDTQILVGTGVSGQVTGIANTEGVNTLSAAASALYTW